MADYPDQDDIDDENRDPHGEGAEDAPFPAHNPTGKNGSDGSNGRGGSKRGASDPSGKDVIGSVMDSKPKLVPINRRVGRRPSIEYLMDYMEGRYRQMLQFIQLGATEWRCAELIGITAPTFNVWKARGEREYREWEETTEKVERGEIDEPDEEYELSYYAKFFQDVAHASSRAVTMAEMGVRQNQPLAWLRLGPGKSRPGRPGWTELSEEEKQLELAMSNAAGNANLVEFGQEQVEDADLAATLFEMETAGLIHPTDQLDHLTISPEKEDDSIDGIIDSPIDGGNGRANNSQK